MLMPDMGTRGKALITGATGYIGQSLALRLAAEGQLVHLLVRDARSDKLPVHEHITVFQGDITDREAIDKAIAECAEVYHIAALDRVRHASPFGPPYLSILIYLFPSSAII